MYQGKPWTLAYLTQDWRDKNLGLLFQKGTKALPIAHPAQLHVYRTVLPQSRGNSVRMLPGRRGKSGEVYGLWLYGFMLKLT